MACHSRCHDTWWSCSAFFFDLRRHRLTVVITGLLRVASSSAVLLAATDLRLIIMAANQPRKERSAAWQALERIKLSERPRTEWRITRSANVADVDHR